MTFGYRKLSVQLNPQLGHILRDFVAGKSRRHGLVGKVTARFDVIVADGRQSRANLQSNSLALVVRVVQTVRRNVVYLESNGFGRNRRPTRVNGNVARHFFVKVKNLAARLCRVPVVKLEVGFGRVGRSCRLFALFDGLRGNGRAAVRVKGHRESFGCAADKRQKQQRCDQNCQNNLFHGSFLLF